MHEGKICISINIAWLLSVHDSTWHLIFRFCHNIDDSNSSDTFMKVYFNALGLFEAYSTLFILKIQICGTAQCLCLEPQWLSVTWHVVEQSVCQDVVKLSSEFLIPWANVL